MTLFDLLSLFSCVLREKEAFELLEGQCHSRPSFSLVYQYSILIIHRKIDKLNNSIFPLELDELREERMIFKKICKLSFNVALLGLMRNIVQYFLVIR